MRGIERVAGIPIEVDVEQKAPIRFVGSICCEPYERAMIWDGNLDQLVQEIFKLGIGTGKPDKIVMNGPTYAHLCSLDVGFSYYLEPGLDR